MGEINVVGGSYLVDPATGEKTCVEPPTQGFLRKKSQAMDLNALADKLAAEVIAALPSIQTIDELHQLATIEAASKNRVTVLDAINAELAKR